MTRMLRIPRLALAAAACTAALPTLASADPGEITPIAVGTQGNNFGYIEYLPQAYDESQDWPLLIFLSGIGEFGTGQLPPGGGCPNGPNYGEPVLCRNLRHGPQNLIWRQERQGQTGLWNDVERPFIVISPQNDAPLFTYVPYDVGELEVFVDYLVDTYAVDEQRIYLTGMSMGGYSALLSANRDADRYAAIATMPGVNTLSAAGACNLTRAALWAFHGEFDTDPFDPPAMVQLVDQYNRCPGPNPAGRFTMYDDAGHDVWTRTIDPSLGMASPVLTSWTLPGGTVVPLQRYDVDLYTWLLQHDKPSVSAGPDLVTAAAGITLGASVIDEDAYTLAWRQVSGAATTLSSATSATPRVSGLAAGSYAFEVQVVDADGMWEVDTVQVTVVGDETEDPDDDGGSTGSIGEGSTGLYDLTTGADPEGTGGIEGSTGGEDPPPPPPVECATDLEATGDLAALSDEFDHPGSLACWNVLEPADGTGIPLDLLDIDVDVSTPGSLTAVSYTSGGWFGQYEGAHLYKEVTGDFMLEVSVSARSLASDAMWPSLPFNSAGIVVRQPPAVDSDGRPVPGPENWLMWDIGMQASRPGTEGKLTLDSSSVLTLHNLGPVPTEARLRVCRVGDDFVLSRRLPTDPGFVAVHDYTIPGLDETVQAGPCLTSWNGRRTFPEPGLVPDVVGRWDYARFSRIDDLAACTSDDVPSCTDAILNQGETDVDCGGPCAPCLPDTPLVTAALNVYTSWGSGYCASLLVSNFGFQPIEGWTVVLESGQSQTYTAWNGSFSAQTGQITVTPLSWNQTVAPGQTRDLGFCANVTGPAWQPSIVSVGP